MEYKYSAFISHSGNLREAKKLQRKIDGYRLPISLREKNGGSFLKRIFFPKKLFNCILDKTDFSPNYLKQEIYRYIENSKDLIVICSPNTGNPKKDKPDFVSDEIQHFLGLERKEKRPPIPFIVDGEPYTKDENECYPNIFRENRGKKSELLGVNLKNDGWFTASIRVIAKLLDLPFDVLYQREKRRRRRRRILTSVFVLSLIMLAFFGHRQILKSEYANKAQEIIKNIEDTGDYYNAKRDALKISPSRWRILRPYVPEAEEALRIAMSRNDLYLSVAPVDFTPDGRFLIATTQDSITFINPGNPKNKEVKNNQFKRGVASVYGSLHFHPDGIHVIWRDGTKVKIGDITNFSVVDSFAVEGDKEVFSQDCRYMVTSDFRLECRRIHLYDISKKCEINNINNENYSSAIFDASNKYVAFYDREFDTDTTLKHVLKCYSVENMRLEKTFQLPSYYVSNLSFSPDGKKLLCKSGQNLLLNINDGSIKQLPTHLQHIVFHPVENCIVGTHENSIVFYDTSGCLIDSIPLCYKLYPFPFKISPDGRYLLVSHNIVELKHVYTDKVKGCLLKTNHNNNCFYTLSDSVLYKYNMSKMSLEDSLCLSNTVVLHQWEVLGATLTEIDRTIIDISLQREYIATVRDNNMYLWDFTTKQCIDTIKLASLISKLQFDKERDDVLYVIHYVYRGDCDLMRQSDRSFFILPPDHKSPANPLKVKITRLIVKKKEIQEMNSCRLRYDIAGYSVPHHHLGIINEMKYFTTFNDTLLVIDPLKSMSVEKIIRTDNAIINCWLNNNKMFVFEKANILCVYDANSLKEEETYQLGKYYIYNPQYNIHEKKILYKANEDFERREQPSLRMIDTKSSYIYSINKLVEHVNVTNFMFTPDEQHIVYSDNEYTYIVDFPSSRQLVERALAVCQ